MTEQLQPRDPTYLEHHLSLFSCLDRYHQRGVACLQICNLASELLQLLLLRRVAGDDHIELAAQLSHFGLEAGFLPAQRLQLRDSLQGVLVLLRFAVAFRLDLREFALRCEGKGSGL